SSSARYQLFPYTTLFRSFAFRAKDTKDADSDNPVTFEIVEHIGAGILPDKEIKTGQATRIMTGAQIPVGADCVAMLENCNTYERSEEHTSELQSRFDLVC